MATTALALVVACPAYAANGTIAPRISAGDDPAAVELDDNGQIVVAGTANDLNGDSHFFVARFNSDGTLDPTFDGDSGTGNGVVETRNIPGSDARVSAMAIQADDKIVVAGRTESASTDTDFALVRYLPNGKLDTTFGGGDGIVTTDFDNLSDLGTSVALATGGGIIVGGFSDIDTTGNHHFALARYTSAGSLDMGFDGDGRVTTVISAMGFIDEIHALAIRPGSGQVVAAGESSDGNTIDFTFARYSDTTGALDNAFDGDSTTGNGIVKVQLSSPSTAPDRARAVAISAGKIVAAGQAFGGTNFDVGLVRLNETDGTLDTAFDGPAGNPGGGNGKVIIPVGPGASFDDATSVGIDGLNGKTVVGGEADPDDGGDLGRDFAVVRLNTSTGVLDTGFDGDGKAFTSFGPFDDQIWDLDVKSSTGEIIALGSAEPVEDDRRIGLARYTSDDGSLDATFDGDATPPTTTILMGPAPGSTTLDRTPTFTFGANEFVNRFQCKVDAGAFAACSSPRTTSTLADGTHTFQVRGTDVFGNTGAAASRTFKVTHVASGGGGGGGTADNSVVLRVSAKKTQRAGKLKIKVSCPLEACNVAVSGSVKTPKMKAARTFKLKRRRISLKANQRKIVTVKLSRKSLKRLRKALRKRSVRRKARARITVTATDAAGNKKTKKLKLKLRR